MGVYFGTNNAPYGSYTGMYLFWFETLTKRHSPLENEQSKNLRHWSEHVCVDGMSISIHNDVMVVPDFLRKIKRMCKQWIPGSFFSLCLLRAQVGGYLVPRKEKK